MRSLYLNSVFLLLLSQTLHGQGNWKVSPMVFDLRVARGDTILRSFSVYNNTDEEIEFRIYQKDWVFTREGGDLESEPGTHPRGCSAWITTAPQTFTVASRSSQSVRFTLRVPEMDRVGSHWSAIYIEPFSKPKLASRAAGEGRTISVYLQLRAKVSIVATVAGNLEQVGEITDIKVRYDPVKRNVQILSIFNNTGNTVLKCKGTVEIRDEIGEPVVSFPLKAFTSLPGYDRTVITQHSSALETGSYSALVIVDFFGDYLVAGEAFFEVRK